LIRISGIESSFNNSGKNQTAAQTITQDASSPYQKAKAIESYLKKKLPL